MQRVPNQQDEVQPTTRKVIVIVLVSIQMNAGNCDLDRELKSNNKNVV